MKAKSELQGCLRVSALGTLSTADLVTFFWLIDQKEQGVALAASLLFFFLATYFMYETGLLAYKAEEKWRQKAAELQRLEEQGVIPRQRHRFQKQEKDSVPEYQDASEEENKAQ